MLSEVRYEAFLLVDGVEQEITGDVLYESSDNAVAFVGASSGNAIGISPGIITVTASYGGFQAMSQLEVLAVDGCSARTNHFLLLLDHSKSSLGQFLGTWPTRLEAAQALGQSFVAHLDTAKDNAAVAQFDTQATVTLDFSTDIAAIDAAVTAIASTQNNTNIAAALVKAANHFSDSGITANRIIVLFTDGENNVGDDPLTAAETIRDAGIILIIVGLRAAGGAFKLLQQMASAGFFINALPSNAASAEGWLNGAKSYLCSGNCAPEGDVTVGVGQLNYTAFANWTVTANEVDLIGKNPGGTPLYDLLPGNGLYVDDHGSGPGFFGQLTSLITFNFFAGETYRLSMDIAGHNRTDPTSRSTQIQVGTFLDETVTRSFDDPFIHVSWEFTPGTTMGQIVITGLDSGAEQSYGNLIKNVRLENITTPAVLLDDSFDDENLTFIPPCSGYPDCYTECLEAPIPAQTPDPNALTPIEGFTGGGSVVNCADDEVRVFTRIAANLGDYGNDVGDSGGVVGKEAVAALIDSWNPDYITTNGDNWYGSSVTIDSWERHAGAIYRNYILPYNSVQGLTSSATRNRFHACIGNHDRDPDGRLAISLSQFNFPPVFKNGVWLPSVGYYNTVEGLAEWFIWDSGFDNQQFNQQPDGNDINSVQWDWLAAAVARSTAKYKGLIMHHPGYTSTLTNQEGTGPAGTLVGDGYLNYSASRNVINAAKAIGIDLVLNGHCHNYERLEVNGLPIIINGAGGRELIGFGIPRVWSKARFSAQFGALKMKISQASLITEFWDVDRVLRDSLTIVK